MFLVGYISWPPTMGLFIPATAEVTAIARTAVTSANFLFIFVRPLGSEVVDPHFNYGQVLNSDSFQIPEASAIRFRPVHVCVLQFASGRRGAKGSKKERRSSGQVGAGDGDRTRDIQLGKLLPTLRSTQNQALGAGHQGPSGALRACIEHNSEHKFQVAIRKTEGAQ